MGRLKVYSVIVSILLVGLLFEETSAELPEIYERIENLPYELPINVVPLEYDIDLTLLNNFTAVEGNVELVAKLDASKNKQASTMQMWAEKLRLSKPTEERNRIALSMTANLQITNLDLFEFESIEQMHEGVGKRFAIDTIEQSRRNETIIIPLDMQRPFDYYVKISISYKSKNLSSSQKLFLTGEIYDPNEQRNRVYHAIRLDQKGAPVLLPCFLEPYHKARVSLTINQPEKTSRVLANLLNEEVESSTVKDEVSGLSLQRTRFQKSSVPIPIHSLALVIGPFLDEQSSASSREAVNSVRVNFFEPAGHLREGSLALDFAVKTVNWFHEKMQMKLPKGAHVNLAAVPAFKGWDLELLAYKPVYTERGIFDSFGTGLINHELCLIDESMSSPERKIEAALNVALAVARQWFGNLVAPKSLPDLLITDGIAFHLAIRAVRELEPEFHIDQYVGSHHRWQVFVELTTADPLPALPGAHWPAVRSLRKLVEGEEIIDLLRANVVGSSTQFDEIIRSLVETGTNDGGRLGRDELIGAIASEEFPSQRVGQIVDIKRKRLYKQWLLVDWYDKATILVRLKACFYPGGTGSYSPDEFILPATLQVQSYSVENEIIQEQEIPKTLMAEAISSDKRILDVKDPQAGSWVRVKVGDNQVFPYERMIYTSNFLPHLQGPIQANSLSPIEKIDILRQQMYMIPARMSHTIETVIEYFENEQDQNVLLELLRAIRVYEEYMQGHHEPEVLLEQSLKQLYKRLGGFKASGSESSSITEQQLRSALATMLIRRNDQQVIREARDAFDTEGLDKLAAFLREPVYLAIGREGSPEQRRQLEDRLKVIGFAEERSRISSALRGASAIVEQALVERKIT